MPAKYFVDTNILLYRYSNQDDKKQQIAGRLLETKHCVISVQVINEFCNVIRRKFPAQFVVIEPTLQKITSPLKL